MHIYGLGPKLLQ